VGALAGSSMAAPATGGFLSSVKDATKGLVDKAKSALFPSTIKGNADPSIMPEIQYYAEYAAAAYCDPNHVPGQEVVCGKTICPNIEKSVSYTIIEFAEGQADTTGIVALDETKKSIIVVFRGSHSVRNWIANLAASKVDVDWCKGCEMHKGFHNGYLEVADKIRQTVDDLAKKNPSYEIITAGHSLGGALSQVAAADLRVRGHKVTAFTFGSPRIGNDKLSDFISKQGTNYRVTHLNDPVPRLPLMTMGYQHVSPEYHIFQGDSPISGHDVHVLEGGINFGGNTAADGIVSGNVSAHMHYMVPESISVCAGGFEFRKRSALDPFVALSHL